MPPGNASIIEGQAQVNGRFGISSHAGHLIRNYGESRSKRKMSKQVNCDCGFMVRAQSDDELVQHVQLHARDIHQMEVPREKALEMAKSVEATVTI